MSQVTKLKKEIGGRHFRLLQLLMVVIFLSLIILFAVLLRTLVFMSIKQMLFTVSATTQDAIDRGQSPEEALTPFLKNLEGYCVWVRSPDSDLFSPQLQPGPWQNRLIAWAGDSPQKGPRAFITMINGRPRFVIAAAKNQNLIMVCRADPPFAFGLLVLAGLSVIAGALFLLKTKGLAYLYDPVDRQLTFMHAVSAEQERFFAGVFHDIGTPITSLMQRIENQLELAQPALDHRDMEIMYLDLQRLAQMVSDQLSRVRFSSGTQTRYDSKIFAHEFASLLAIRLAVLAKSMGRQLQVQVDPDFYFLGDRIKLESAVSNLITNAFKYGEGEVTLALKAENMISIEVRDEGHGFDPSRAEQMIQPFARGSIARAGQISGSGLGLFLVDQTAKLHQGSLSFRRSEPGFIAKISLPHRIENSEH